MKTKNIFFIRHGETDWNRDRRFQGAVDIPLNELGKEQALSIKNQILDLNLDLVYSSHLKRAVDTAQMATQDLNLKINKDKRFAEVAVGEAEGLTAEQMTEKFGLRAIERWRSFDERDLDFHFPGGESKRQLMIRVREALFEIINEQPFNNLGIFAHGMLIRSVTHTFKQGVAWDPLVFHNCSIHQFVWDDKKPEFLKYVGKV